MVVKRKGLLGLVDSKRFIALVILLGSFLLIIRFPEYTPYITTIASLFGVAVFVIVGGYTLEQAVEAWRALPSSLADVVRAIVEEVLKSLPPTPPPTDPSTGAVIPPVRSGDSLSVEAVKRIVYDEMVRGGFRAGGGDGMPYPPGAGSP